MPPRLTQLTAVFLRTGNTTFGGGEPTIAALQRELVTKRGWLGNEQFGLAYGLARITPGTNLLAFCAAMAWFLRGWPGSVAAVLAVTVPSSALIVWVTHIDQIGRSNPMAIAAIGGTLAAAVGMMVAGAWLLLWPHARRRTAHTAAIAGCAAFLLLKTGVAPLVILAGAAAAGFFWRDGEE
ncbi:MAG TPA: chromate transporter [Bryobacteraceae bacterium]|nr:chromate transporter [Bryobacteraceae bacterium]